LARNGIRLRYSGFIIFIARLLSLATGLIFQYMVARGTTSHDYGVWFNMNDVLAYFTMFAGVLPFWIMRFTARAERGAGKTGILANLLISIVAFIIYIVSTPFITLRLGVSEYIHLYMLISIQIVEFHLLNVFEACLRAKKPQALGYGLLIGEIFKVVLGFILIVILQKSLEGVIVSLTIAIAAQCIYYFKLLIDDLRQELNWIYVREWMKASIVNIYSIIGNQVASYIFIMLFTYGGEVARGYYGAAAQIANIITYSSFLAFALYPKLISGGGYEDIVVSLKTVLMFAIPMTVGALTLPDLYITILKPEYRDGFIVLIVLAIDALIATLSTLFTSILYGLEKLDEKAKIPFKELIRSRVFTVFSLPYIHSAIALPVAFYLLTYTRNNPLQSALYISMVNLAARIVTFLILYVLTCKMIRIVTPWKNIVKYVFTSITMAFLLHLIREILNPSRVYAIISISILGGVFYLIMLAVIDIEVRELAESAWRIIKSNFKFEV